MRNIAKIVIHCSAGKAQQKTSDIMAYWRQKLGWTKYGYHIIVDADGKVEHLTPDDQITNGVKGHNADSFHICYKGGWDGTDTRTPAQKDTLLNLVRFYRKKYPKARVCGHRDLSPDANGDGKITPNEWVKLCPCFDAQKEYANI